MSGSDGTSDVRRLSTMTWSLSSSRRAKPIGMSGCRARSRAATSQPVGETIRGVPASSPRISIAGSIIGAAIGGGGPKATLPAIVSLTGGGSRQVTTIYGDQTFFGLSWGGAMGAILPAVEPRIKANVLYAGDGLLERVAAEGELSPADVVLTVDIGNLVSTSDANGVAVITQLSPIHSWKSIGPWVVWALKFGAVSLMRRDMAWPPSGSGVRAGCEPVGRGS